MKQLFFIIAIIIFLHISCSEQNNSINSTCPSTSELKKTDIVNIASNKIKPSTSWPTIINDSVYGKIYIDNNALAPDVITCGIRYETGYGIDHYEPISGKQVGVWPSDYSVDVLTELKNKWGCSGILVGPDGTYNNAMQSGFTSNMIMMNVGGIPDAMRGNIIYNYGNLFAYYVGEPADQNHSMGGVRGALVQYGLTSLFIIDGYKRTSALNSCVNQADKVLFSSYHHWYETLPGIWISEPYSADQRSDWSDMKSRYEDKFSMSWINTYEVSEFSLLFGHAQNLGLNGIWVFEEGQREQWENISQAAWRAEFLRRFEINYRIEWRCIYYEDACEECNPNDPEALWYVYSITPIPGSLREVFP